MMKNCPMIPALSLAVWRLGGAFCPLNVASGMTALLRTLDLIEPFGVIVSDSVKKEVGQVLQERGHSLRRLSAGGAPAPLPWQIRNPGVPRPGRHLRDLGHDGAAQGRSPHTFESHRQLSEDP